jgi:hypothetical protein
VSWQREISLDTQCFTKGLCSGDFSRFLAERLKSLLRFRDVLILNLYVSIHRVEMILDKDEHCKIIPKGWNDYSLVSRKIENPEGVTYFLYRLRDYFVTLQA